MHKTLFLLLIFSSLKLHALSCVEAFEKPYELRKEFGWSEKLEDHLNTNGRTDYTIFDRSGKDVGEVGGWVNPRTSIAFVYLNVPAKFQKLGISREFISLFLTAHPQVREFRDMLAEENYRVFIANQKSMTDLAAAEATPYGKVMVENGFRATRAELEDGHPNVYVTFER